jgi:hypothetical protein
LDGLGIFGGGAGIAGLDDIHMEQRQLPGDGEFLPAAKPGAGRLFAVSQSGVEYRYFL